MASGIRLTTIAELQADPAWLEKFYEMMTDIDRDVPSPEPYSPPTFEHFRSSLSENPNFLPEGNFIALDGETWAAMSALWRSEAADHLWVGLTGVRRDYRRRGIALALKLRSIAFARGRGAPTLRTYNEFEQPRNALDQRAVRVPPPRRLDRLYKDSERGVAVAFPLVTLRGSPYEKGCQHGEALRREIGQNLEVYFERFALEGMARAEVLRFAESSLIAIAAQSPAYFAGIQGIAAASGRELEVIAALNLRYEILYYAYGQSARADGCTAFAIPPARAVDGHLLLGQSWDWIPEVRGALIRTVEDESRNAGLRGGGDLRREDWPELGGAGADDQRVVDDRG